jgi:signal transduction histidine kinase
MVRLISDFLNVSRVQTGKFMIDKKDVDLAMVVKQEVNQLKVNASARGLTLETTVPDSPILVQADEGKIRQVLMNFIDNAIYYSPEKTTITVALVEKASDIEITVKDQGIGVPLDEQTKLFEKFFRASNARMQRPDGTGVGLYLAKQVVDGHGGKIIFASTPGQGSTFGFSVPKK